MKSAFHSWLRQLQLEFFLLCDKIQQKNEFIRVGHISVVNNFSIHFFPLDVALAHLETDKRNSYIKAWEESEKSKVENK